MKFITGRESTPHKEPPKRLKGPTIPTSETNSFTRTSGISASTHGSTPSTHTSDTPADEIIKRIMTIKTTVKSIWNPNFKKALHQLVDTVNKIVTHTFAFAKYIFLQELKKDFKFELHKYTNRDFFCGGLP